MVEFVNLPKPPCHGQTEETVKAWLRANVAPGCVVVIRNTQAGQLNYKTATVEHIGPRNIRLDKAGTTGGTTFYFSGKNCFHPKGQTRLVIPTPEVLAACDGLPGYGIGYDLSTIAH